jgi:2-polyprenyl-6-hydroxyphenyl methylase/3-demethylubiquinone-9 3-methyltransferase
MADSESRSIAKQAIVDGNEDDLRSELDTSSHQEFVDDYAEKSLTDQSIERFRRVQQVILKTIGQDISDVPLDIADIGCNAGTFSMMWAEAGHRVVGVDINEPLVEIARKRAADKGLDVDFRIGTAVDLPLKDNSADVCVAEDLIEHVKDWESAVSEFVRILKPGGILWLTTTNALSPVQDEFNLKFFSWYPRFLKDHFIELAMTSRPELANHAKHPAYNWFTPYGLMRHLDSLGLSTMDRFDIAYANKKPSSVRTVLGFIRAVPPLRFLGHVFTPFTMILSRKR